MLKKLSCLGLNNFDDNFLQTSLKTLTFNCKSTGGRMPALKSFYRISRKGIKVQGGGGWEGRGGKDLQNTFQQKDYMLSVIGYISTLFMIQKNLNQLYFMQ